MTLAYAFDDNAVATVARYLNLTEDEQLFRNRSEIAYKLLWSQKDELLCPKWRDGHLTCPSSFMATVPYNFGSYFTEGDAL